MPGKEARDGFWFQDAKALTRLLADLIERRRCAVLGVQPGPELVVRVESPVAVTSDLIEDEDAPSAELPAWDATFARGNDVVLEECKLGGPTRDDRLTLYRRIRSTIEGGVSIDRISVRLTAGRGRILSPDTWRELPGAAQTSDPPATPPKRVANARSLAAEALHFLTTAEPNWKARKRKKRDDESDDDSEAEKPLSPTTPLSLDDARKLLSRFELDEGSSIDEVEAELRAQLDVLGAELTTDQIVYQLRGWIDDVARERGTPTDLTSSSLLEQLDIVARYGRIPVEVEALWHRLRQAFPAGVPSVITPQRWRDVQPNVDEVLRRSPRATTRRLALVSEGGVGKSYLLASIYAECSGLKVWVDPAAPLNELEQALALGAWAAAQRNDVMTIVIDTIDQVKEPTALLASVDRALAGRDCNTVLVGARLATWSGCRERLPAWEEVRLAKWDKERVRPLAEQGRGQPLSDDLLELLRTPLLLDLFLRTFAPKDRVPPGLATRHGVVRSYFERRVLPEAHPAAADRRMALDRGVTAILANATSWQDSSHAAQELVSEGVITSTLGTLRFRHALLRDFATALELSPRSASTIAQALAAVDSPIVRNELLRGVLEAVLDPSFPRRGPSAPEVVGACLALGLSPGIALGTTDAPTAALFEAIAQLENGVVLRQSVMHASLIDNRSWLRVPAHVGGSRPAWFGPVHLEAVADLADFALATGDPACPTLAVTLREWTIGFDAGDKRSWSLGKIGELLTRVAPGNATVSWYETLDFSGTPFLRPFLEQLRDLGAATEIGEEHLLRALQKLILVPGRTPVDGHALWEVAHLALWDEDGRSGLLRTRPRVALAILFALSVAEEEEKSRLRRERFPESAVAELLARFPAKEDIQEAEARLRLEPTLTRAEALGDLVDDAPSSSGTVLDEIDALFEDTTQSARDDVAFAEAFMASALASRSVRARIVALALSGSTVLTAGRQQILRDPRMYHVLYASHALWEAINRDWPILDAETRSDVQTHIIARARSPILGVTSVGRLASAIPRADLAPTLIPYVEFLEGTGRGLVPGRPSQMSVYYGSPDDDDDELHKVAETPPALVSQWRRIEELSSVETDVAVRDAVSAIQALLASNGLAKESPEWVWSAVSRVLRSAEKRKQTIDAAEASPLFELALAAAARRHGTDDADAWGTLLQVGDSCIAIVDGETQSTMRKRLMDEVSAGVGSGTPHPERAWRAMGLIRPAVWFHEDSGGLPLFDTWFRKHLVGDALHIAVARLRFRPRDECVELVRAVLETEGRFNSEEQRSSFASDAGHLFADWSLWWEEPWAREAVQRWCESAERVGVIESVSAWRSFLSGFAWSLQDQVRRAPKDPRVPPGIARYVNLMTLAWSAWTKVLDDANRNISVGWSVTAPLAHDFTTLAEPPGESWSVSLCTLLCRVIEEGGREDLAALGHVHWLGLDRDTLVAAASALVRRADAEAALRPTGDWVLDALASELGNIGVVDGIPLAQGNAVLDCLHRLGRTVPKATIIAARVERALRERERSAER